MTDTTTCPIMRTAMILGSRWTAQIIQQLLAREVCRFSDLQAALGAISPTTLSQRLKMLEESGIVSREVHDTHPPRTDYRLTEKGRKMGGIIRAMRDWGLKHG